MAIHLFIDTNIYLNFYHFNNDDVASLDSLTQKLDNGTVILHLPVHVMNEWERNRETKLKTAANEFKKTAFQVAIPRHMTNLSMAQQYTEAIGLAKRARDVLIAEATAKARTYQLEVDEAIAAVFVGAQVHLEDDIIYGRGKMRADKGNPPGKNGSVGDQYNWEMLLDKVPAEDLYIISKDGDYASPLPGNDANGMAYPNAFLQAEWRNKKSRNLYIFDSLKGFLRHHDRVVLPAEAAIAAAAVVAAAAAVQPEGAEAESLAEPIVENLANANEVPEAQPADEPIQAPAEPLEAAAPPVEGAAEEVALGNAALPAQLVAAAAAAAANREHLAEATPEERLRINQLVSALADSESFYVTHRVIESFRGLEDKMVKADADALADAAAANNQIRWIISDSDVNQFYLRLLSRHIAELDPVHVDNLISMLGIDTDESVDEEQSQVED